MKAPRRRARHPAHRRCLRRPDRRRRSRSTGKVEQDTRHPAAELQDGARRRRRCGLAGDRRSERAPPTAASDDKAAKAPLPSASEALSAKRQRGGGSWLPLRISWGRSYGFHGPNTGVDGESALDVHHQTPERGFMKDVSALSYAVVDISTPAKG